MIFDWNKHYENGGKSAEDNNYLEPTRWKHDILNRYYTPGKDTIIDVGCGDLQFWNGYLRPEDRYMGIDISQEIINRHRKNHPNQHFITSSSDQGWDISADVVICIDMLYHILDDDVYIKTLQNIKRYAKRNILIFTWHKNPLAEFPFWFVAMIVQFKKTLRFPRDWSFTSDGNYQKYRDFLKIAEPILQPEFKLIEQHQWIPGKYGTMYVFQREPK